MPAGQPEAPPAPGYEFSQVEQAPQPQAGDMTPVPATPEAPPETVPDVTPDAGAPGPDGTHAEPETMEMDGQAPAVAPGPAYTAEAPAPEIRAGEVEQGPAASAASLLQALQKPVPRLETEAEQPPAPSAEAPAPTPADAGEHFEAALMSKATESEHAPAEIEQKDVKPITRVRCAGCKAAIPIFSAQRPLVVTCPQCGRMGMLK
jgi:hypothetical protein